MSAAESAVASWLTGGEVAWERLVTIGPAGFASYARLRFIPDPTYLGQQEADVDVDVPSDQQQLRTAMAVLTSHTSTPEDCFVCVWEGWGWQPADRAPPTVTVPHRRYHLLRGSLADLRSWGHGDDPRGPGTPTPAFVWPADRAWCFTHDVDPHYAGVGSTAAAVDALEAEATLDVVPTDPDASQPRYG